jgi:hypothetical protein
VKNDLERSTFQIMAAVEEQRKRADVAAQADAAATRQRLAHTEAVLGQVVAQNSRLAEQIGSVYELAHARSCLTSK